MKPLLLTTLLLTLSSVQAITQTISEDGILYADLESFARDIGAGIALNNANPIAWRLAAAGKDMVLVQDSNLVQFNGKRYQMAGKVLLEGGKGYAPLDSLRALFQVNVVTNSITSTISSGKTSSSAGNSGSSAPSVEGTVQQPNFSREDILAAVNRVRAQTRMCGEKSYPAAKPLRWNPVLEQAALKHSKNMADNQFYSHDDPQGNAPHDRMLGAGYVGYAMGENIDAFYTDDPDKVLERWVRSPGHCANLMYPDFTDFGLGVYFLPYDKKKQYLRLWTQNFGG